ncbi:TPA: apolipoprotein N-acyltransferase [Pasteurella multocida]|nr:apolipoprotein N-acyltransferase [Pasteurella multocida]HDR1790898.1 apolipoprotein N-acyltransferase [Pasteurella multocida]HDR1828271.1 apolipoprotein N-acyltransferase [Pasteurella multocida]HDR1896491.1 apolipoprotein N-acyltransferase [Pasteurella multocida]
MKKKIFTYFIALFSGMIGVLAFSPFDYWGCAYLSLLGLIFVAKTAEKKTALWSAFLWGLAFFTFGINWVHVSIHQFGGASVVVSYVLVLVLAAYLALYPMLFAYLIQRFQISSLAMFPVIWTFTEFLRGWLFTGFPWLQFGYSQIDSPFAHLAPMFGVTGVTFFVMWVSAVIFNLLSVLLIKPRKWNVVIANLLLFTLVGGLSAYSSKAEYVRKIENRDLLVTLAQGNIEQNLKWEPEYLYQTLDIYHKLISQHLGKTDVIILPESALPVLENHIQPFFQGLQAHAQQAGTEIVMGTIYQDETANKLLNSIITLGNTDFPYSLATTNRYSKHHLVPFGEYVPLETLLRPLGSVFNLPMSAFQSGDEIQSPLVVKNRQLSAAICYEIILGEQLRKNVKQDTDFILTVSNDAWFGDSIGPWQHLQMARMRALEFGKPVIRATNTGISVFIDEQGKIVAQAPQFIETTLTHKVTATEGQTPYAVFGNTAIYGLSLLLLLMRGFGALIRRRLFMPRP